MIDIARDYAAIAMGTSQATTARVASTAHSAILGAAWTIRPTVAAEDRPSGGLGVGRAVARVRGLAGDVLHAQADRVAGLLGLVSESEVTVLQQRIHRLERRIADLRSDR